MSTELYWGPPSRNANNLIALFDAAKDLQGFHDAAQMLRLVECTINDYQRGRVARAMVAAAARAMISRAELLDCCEEDWE
jgi:hypothetical protein